MTFTDRHELTLTDKITLSLALFARVERIFNLRGLTYFPTNDKEFKQHLADIQRLADKLGINIDEQVRYGYSRLVAAGKSSK